MQNKLLLVLSLLLGLVTVGLLGVTFAGILTFAATTGVAVALFAAQLLLLGFDMWIRGKKFTAFLTLLPAAMGLAYAAMLFF
jgi:hypothetical protein